MVAIFLKNKFQNWLSFGVLMVKQGTLVFQLMRIMVLLLF